MATITEELATAMAQLSPQEQERVLSFARALAQPPVYPHTPLPPGTPGSVVANLRVSPEAGEAMEKALNLSHMSLPPGRPPDALLRLRVDPETGEAMEQALEDCEGD